MTGTIVVLGWPVVVAVLYAWLRPAEATIWAILAGYLLLPTHIAFDPPMLPTFDKYSIPSLAALACLLLVARPKPAWSGAPPEADLILPGWLPQDRIFQLFMAMLVLGELGTVLTNGDRLNYGGRSLPPLQLYDAMSRALGSMVALVPLILARKVLSHPDGNRLLLVCLCIAGAVYTLPTLFEVRMSPRLNSMIYGFFAHDWRQHIRDGGYRPIVFLSHGLVLGIFLCCALLAAVGAARLGGPRRLLYAGMAVVLAVTLVLAKVVGATMIAVLLVPVLLFTRIRVQLLVAAVLAGMVISYPMLRNAGLAPVDRVASFADHIDRARADSFRFRVMNEDILLAKASKRPLFGWGGWGRSRVFDEKGRDISITDGHWVITFGVGGWVRYIALYGLLAGPVILTALYRRRYEATAASAALCIVLVANLLDLIPNSGLSPMTYLLAGAVLGRLEWARRLGGAVAQPERAAVLDGPVSAGAVRQPRPATAFARTRTVSSAPDSGRDSPGGADKPDRRTPPQEKQSPRYRRTLPRSSSYRHPRKT